MSDLDYVIIGSGINIPVEVKFYGHFRAAVHTAGADEFDGFYFTHPLFYQLGNAGFHHGGRGSQVVGFYRNDGGLNIRVFPDHQAGVAHQAESQDQ